MTRTRIETIDHNRVDIAFDTEGYDGTRRRRLSLWAPSGGGYVLDMSTVSPDFARDASARTREAGRSSDPELPSFLNAG